MPEHFFIVGAQRSATTYLYHLCDEHPDIEMAKPIRPEPKFFLMDDLYRLGLDYYESHFFQEETDVRLRGEKSTSYMESEKSVQRIATHFPAAKILFLLREPVARAVSHYWFSVNNGFETLPLEQAFLEEEERWQDYDPAQVSVSPYAYLRRGCYIDNILMYERYFPSANLKVMLHESFVGSLEAVRELYAFLGVAPDFHPPSLAEKNINTANKQEVSFSPQLERFLSDYFIEPNRQLAEHLGISLAVWE